MSRTTSPEPIRPERPRFELPPLHPAQQEVAEDKARFKVVVCGRQWGKTLLGAVICVKSALEGGHIWWVAPSFQIGELGWREVDDLCRQVDQAIGGCKFEGRPVYRITLPTGGSIQLRSADNPDSLRGATLDGVVFDEAAQAKLNTWPTLEPTLAIRQGWAMFISTPRGLNWFYDVFTDAGAMDGWQRWQLPSASSPFIQEDTLESAKQRLGSLFFSQEYGAEFISTATGVFRADWLQHYAVQYQDDERYFMLGDEPVSEGNCSFLHTVDLAFSQAEGADFTVISTWALTRKAHLVLVDMQRGHFEAPEVIPRMRAAQQRYGGHVVVEKTTQSASIIQVAQREGIVVRPVRADRDKTARAWPAAAVMEARRLWFPPRTTPWWPEIEEELLGFPAGRHDDFVDTLAYAVLELSKSGVPKGVEWA